MNNVIRLPGAWPPRIRPLLSAYDIRDQCGVSLEFAYRILHAHGIKSGRRYVISEDKLARVLEEVREI